MLSAFRLHYKSKYHAYNNILINSVYLGHSVFKVESVRRELSKGKCF